MLDRGDDVDSFGVLSMEVFELGYRILWWNYRLGNLYRRMRTGLLLVLVEDRDEVCQR